MERRVNVRGVMLDDDENIFAVKHRDKDTNGESDFWAIPGGGLDVGESTTNGLVREFDEELGVTPTIGRLLFIQQFIFTHRDGRKSEKMELFFHVTNTADFANVDLSKTTHGHEITRVAFINPKVSDLLPSFLKDMDIRNHLDKNQPVLLFDNLKESSR